MKNPCFILLFLSFELPAQEIAIYSNTVCEGSVSSLSAFANVHDSLVAAYLWDLDSDGYFDDATGKEIQNTFPAADTFAVSVQARLHSGQSYISDEHPVIVHPVPLAGFTGTHLCMGDPVTLANTTGFAGTGSLSYAWDVDGDGVTDSEERDLEVLLPGTGRTITLVATSGKGCSDTLSKEIVLEQKPVSDFSFENACRNDTVDFINSSTISGGTIAYSVWNFGDSVISISEHPAHAFLQAGMFPVQLVSITGDNCSDTITREIEIYELPGIEIQAEDTVLFFKGEVRLSAQSGAQDILWSTGSSETEISVNAEGTYTVRAKDQNACINADTIRIYKLAVNEKVIKSQILTPNGDGINDVLEIKEMFRHYRCQVFVYNEWGQQVYSSTDYQNDWDCYSGGNYLKTGAYYYLIRLNDLSFRGCVNVLRPE